MSEKVGSGMSYASLCAAKKIAKELGTEFELDDCIVLDDVAIKNELEPRKYIWQTMQYPRWWLFTQLEKK